VLRDQVLELGPFIGAPTPHTRIKVGDGPDVPKSDNYLSCDADTQSELVVLIRDQRDVVVAQIDIDSHTPPAFGSAALDAVSDVASCLGRLWRGYGSL
jgi:L-methionine (R)-S-oxide reductase